MCDSVLLPSTSPAPIRPLSILKRPFIIRLRSLGIFPQQILFGKKRETTGHLIVYELAFGIVKYLIEFFEGKLFRLLDKEKDENKSNNVETSKEPQCTGHLELGIDTREENGQEACEKEIDGDCNGCASLSML
jgi:hypothetical protein